VLDDAVHGFDETQKGKNEIKDILVPPRMEGGT
jgi:hypothetical protein